MALWHLLAAFNTARGFSSGDDATTAKVTLELDATVSEEPDYTAVVTKNAVERGADVTDHVARNPLTLTVEAVISNTPANYLKVLKGQTLAFGNKTLAMKGYTYLVKLFQEAQPFTFVGGLDVYRNMVITSLSTPRRSGTGDALIFTCKMQQVNIIESKAITLEKLKDRPPKDQAKCVPVVDKGFQPVGTFTPLNPTAKVATNVANTPLGKFVKDGGSYPMPKPLSFPTPPPGWHP